MAKKPSNVESLKEHTGNTITARLERQIFRVLDDLENLPIGPKERVAALYTIGRLQIIFNTLARGQRGDTGSSVRKYAQAFQTHAGRGRASIARPAIVDAPDDLDDDDEPEVA